jgi:hypothetical protein
VLGVEFGVSCFWDGSFVVREPGYGGDGIFVGVDRSSVSAVRSVGLTLGVSVSFAFRALRFLFSKMIDPVDSRWAWSIVVKWLAISVAIFAFGIWWAHSEPRKLRLEL